MTFDDWTTRSGKWRRDFTLKLVQRYGWICCICGLPIKKPKDLSCQHMKPRSKGGRTTFENCRPAHLACNSSLRDRHSDGPSGIVYDGRRAFYTK